MLYFINVRKQKKIYITTSRSKLGNFSTSNELIITILIYNRYIITTKSILMGLLWLRGIGRQKTHTQYIYYATINGQRRLNYVYIVMQ